MHILIVKTLEIYHDDVPNEYNDSIGHFYFLERYSVNLCFVDCINRENLEELLNLYYLLFPNDTKTAVADNELMLRVKAFKDCARILNQI